MVIFAAVTFCIIPITFAIVASSHIMSDISLDLVLWPLRLIFIASPWIAFSLGLRGSLPGTKPLARSANTVLKILTPIVVVIGVLFTVGAWVAFLPPPGRPNISITLLGYTNGATGSRLAKIAVTNLNATTIYVYAPRVEIPAPTDPGGYKG